MSYRDFALVASTPPIYITNLVSYIITLHIQFVNINIIFHIQIKFFCHYWQLIRRFLSVQMTCPLKSRHLYFRFISFMLFKSNIIKTNYSFYLDRYATYAKGLFEVISFLAFQYAYMNIALYNNFRTFDGHKIIP